MSPLLLPRPASVRPFDMGPPPPPSSPSTDSSSGGGANLPPLATYTSYHHAHEATAFGRAMRAWITFPLTMSFSPASSVTDAVCFYAATFAVVVALFALSRACVVRMRRAKRRRRAQRAASMPALALERGRMGASGSGSGSGWGRWRDGQVERGRVECQMREAAVANVLSRCRQETVTYGGKLHRKCAKRSQMQAAFEFTDMCSDAARFSFWGAYLRLREKTLATGIDYAEISTKGHVGMSTQLIGRGDLPHAASAPKRGVSAAPGRPPAPDPDSCNADLNTTPHAHATKRPRFTTAAELVRLSAAMLTVGSGRR
ncbi:hypothetical protein IWX90DRAFT_507792 [Phyllosticta citrichinensis]|uniref:Uncharacterized protein n=1 Tax=Phyllosticta citrichinensis TaxID=1130410 RepID=A0ABR1XKW4_9PEZI